MLKHALHHAPRSWLRSRSLFACVFAYTGDVLGKMPVIQHFLFGSLLPCTWEASPAPAVNPLAGRAPWAQGMTAPRPPPPPPSDVSVASRSASPISPIDRSDQVKLLLSVLECARAILITQSCPCTDRHALRAVIKPLRPKLPEVPSNLSAEQQNRCNRRMAGLCYRDRGGVAPITDHPRKPWTPEPWGHAPTSHCVERAGSLCKGKGEDQKVKVEG